MSLNRIKSVKYKFLIIVTGLLLLLLIGSYFSAQNLLKKQIYSTVLFDVDKQMLAARISKDGQWRFPRRLPLEQKYIDCVIEFEDKRFYFHPGVDPFAIVRAVVQNFKALKIQSGASTLSMQAARLLLGNQQRTYIKKMLECWLAIGLEMNYSKSEILDLYSGFAPLGGNVVGYDAALWRYFKKCESNLTWAQAALLAVLPNQPASVHIERNRDLLKKRRNSLLLRMKLKEFIDAETYELAVQEPIPERMQPIPQNSGLLIDYLIKRYPDQYEFQTSIVEKLQLKLSEIVNRHAELLRDNEIHNCAVLLIENKSGFVKSYIANTPISEKQRNNLSVDNIQSLRSSGSVLKPLLVAASMEKGIINQKSHLSDVPCLIGGFRPENFSRQYQGYVSIQDALRHSLNIPAVRLLQQYGLNLFHDQLHLLGFTSIKKPPDHYGLSLILGGAEISAWELAKVYSNLAFQLEQRSYIPDEKKRIYRKGLKLFVRDSSLDVSKVYKSPISDGAIYEMFRLLQSPVPLSDASNSMSLNHEFLPAWKTGTSFGFKDAWCVGITPEYTLVVWIGNSNGLGRPGLIGVHTAAPLMLEIIRSLGPFKPWIKPIDEMHQEFICKRTGLLVSPLCPEIDTIWQSSRHSLYPVCTYHQTVFVDPNFGFRVTKDCESKAIKKNVFVLPPVEENYYNKVDLSYLGAPNWRQDCLKEAFDAKTELAIIYPLNNAVLYLPKDIDSHENNFIFSATHKNNQASLHWFLDEFYITSTIGRHEIEIKPQPGFHFLLIMDDQGLSQAIRFQCARG